MIATSTVVLFGLTHLNTFSFDHMRLSETRAYMALVMGAAVAVITLGYKLAVGFIEAQRPEIDEMNWLIADIAASGPAETTEAAEARPTPEYVGVSDQSCG